MRAAFARRIGPTDRKKLIAGIHAQAHALQLDDDARRDLQRNLVGVESSKDMSLAQLGTVWHRLTALAQDAGLGRAASRRRVGREGENDGPRMRKSRPGRDERLPQENVTREQLTMIEELFAAVGVQPSTQMMQLCRRACGKPWAQTREDGNKIVEMLKAMAARGWRAKEGARDTEGSVLADRAVADSPRSTRAMEPSRATHAEGEGDGGVQ